MDWAFNAQKDSEVVRACLNSLSRAAETLEYGSGFPVGSICTGWGVAEMVLSAMNSKLKSLNPKLPEALWLFLILLSYVSGARSS